MCACARSKVRDYSHMNVTIQPAEFGSWADARSELMIEAKRPLQAQLDSQISAAVNESDIKQLRAAFRDKEREIEHDIDHKQMEFHLNLGVAYNVREHSNHTPRTPAAQLEANPSPNVSTLESQTRLLDMAVLVKVDGLSFKKKKPINGVNNHPSHPLSRVCVFKLKKI